MTLTPFRGKCWHCGHDHDRLWLPAPKPDPDGRGFESLARRLHADERAELEWVRNVLAEFGYVGPLAEACCPLREMLSAGKTSK